MRGFLIFFHSAQVKRPGHGFRTIPVSQKTQSQRVMTKCGVTSSGHCLISSRVSSA